eukprot:jgi/Chlat1/4154/Chrsp27S04263
MDPAVWRSELTVDDRRKVINKIVSVLQRTQQVSDPNQVKELFMIASRYEERTFNTATTKKEYLDKITARLQQLQQKAASIASAQQQQQQQAMLAGASSAGLQGAVQQQGARLQSQAAGPGMQPANASTASGLTFVDPSGNLQTGLSNKPNMPQQALARQGSNAAALNLATSRNSGPKGAAIGGGSTGVDGLLNTTFPRGASPSMTATSTITGMSAAVNNPQQQAVAQQPTQMAVELSAVDEELYWQKIEKMRNTYRADLVELYRSLTQVAKQPAVTAAAATKIEQVRKFLHRIIPLLASKRGETPVMVDMASLDRYDKQIATLVEGSKKRLSAQSKTAVPPQGGQVKLEQQQSQARNSISSMPTVELLVHDAVYFNWCMP